jgi:hypothetical protein
VASSLRELNLDPFGQQPQRIPIYRDEPEFVDRVRNNQNYPVINNPDGSVSTHRMAAESDANGNWYVFPTIQMQDGELVEYYDSREAMDAAFKTGNILRAPNKQSALNYAEGAYKRDTGLGNKPTTALMDIEELAGYTQENPMPVGADIMTQQEAISELTQREESARVAGTVSPFESSWNPTNPNFRATAQNAISNMLGGSNIASSDNYLGGRVANTLTGLLDFAPVVGDAVGVGDTMTSYRQGDMLGTGINALATGVGVLPLVGGPASKIVKAGGNKVRSSVSRVLSDVTEAKNKLSARGITGPDAEEIIEDVTQTIMDGNEIREVWDLDEEGMELFEMVEDAIRTKPEALSSGGVKYQWMRNAEGGQTGGNKQSVVPFTEDLFNEVRDEGSLRSKTYEEYRRKFPDVTHISVIDMADGTRRTGAIGSLDELRPPQKHFDNGWVIETNDFDSPEALLQLQTADSDLVKAGGNRARSALRGLEMNSEARMARADEGGFEEDIYYKGMYPYDYTKESGNYAGPEITEINRPDEFPAFNKGEEGVDIAGFLTKDPEVANRFAGSSGSGAVYPLRYRRGEVYTIDANGRNAGELQFGESGKEFRDAVRSGNYDTIEIINTADEGDITIATQPKNIRSINAEFDPTKADSSDLLSSISPTQSSLRNIA